MLESFIRQSMRRHLTNLLVIVLVTVAAGVLPGCGNRGPSPSAVKSAKPASYHCPMHPTVTSDKPGRCPICHMNLVPIAADSTAADSTGGHSTS